MLRPCHKGNYKRDGTVLCILGIHSQFKSIHLIQSLRAFRRQILLGVQGTLFGVQMVIVTSLELNCYSNQQEKGLWPGG